MRSAVIIALEDSEVYVIQRRVISAHPREQSSGNARHRRGALR